MDYSTYDLDFTGAGRRRVHLFSYVLGYSRRQYLRFVEAQDLPTTLREHIHAFEYLGGVAATPLRAYATESALVGAPWSIATVRAASKVLQAEGTPISDHRASMSHPRTSRR